MAATLGATPSGRDDTEYQEALHYFHLGQWDQAIHAFEDLRTRYPNDPRLERMIQDARFKANLEAQSTVREKRWIIPWRAIILRVAMIGVVILLLAIGSGVIFWRVLPMINQMQLERQQSVMLADAKALIESGDLSGAEQKYQQLLTKFPDLAEAKAGLDTVHHEQELFGIYDQAMKAEKDGDDETALKLYNDLQIKAPGYRDTGARILAIRHRGDLDKLYERAQTLKKLGLEPEAIDALFQVQALDVNFRQKEVRELLAALNLKQGQRIVTSATVDASQVPQALDFFNAALEQKPNDAVALTEARLAVGFIAGREAYDQGRWDEAVSRLRTVYNERPEYLNKLVAVMLYQALINLGDKLRPDDLLAAYEQYSQACNLPVPDHVTACAKASDIIPLLTPTPTPTLTPTPGPTPPTPTPAPTATPRPLDMFKGRIIFKADNPDKPGYYVMNPDGSNREYLGPFQYYDALYNQMRETERYSPDHTYWVTTGDVDKRPQIIMNLPKDPKWGQLPPKPLTRLTGIAYDPVWAPDGSLIAFTTDENGSDDIWVIRPDSSGQKSLVRNDWEWDKHPSWSPDSQRIAFFSNRFGARQIFIMDATGQNPINISNQPWDEYDPIWVK